PDPQEQGRSPQEPPEREDPRTGVSRSQCASRKSRPWPAFLRPPSLAAALRAIADAMSKIAPGDFLRVTACARQPRDIRTRREESRPTRRRAVACENITGRRRSPAPAAPRPPLQVLPRARISARS